MAVALNAKPPQVGEFRPVDGGIALCHNGWLVACGGWTAFAISELFPVPDSLTCAHCGVATKVGPYVRRKIERLFSGPGGASPRIRPAAAPVHLMATSLTEASGPHTSYRARAANL